MIKLMKGLSAFPLRSQSAARGLFSFFGPKKDKYKQRSFRKLYSTEQAAIDLLDFRYRSFSSHNACRNFKSDRPVNHIFLTCEHASDE